MRRRRRQLEHDFFNPYKGADLRCRACGLWHALWDGNYCSGPVDCWPQPGWHITTWDMTIEPDAQFLAKVRCVGFHNNQISVILEKP